MPQSGHTAPEGVGGRAARFGPRGACAAAGAVGMAHCAALLREREGDSQRECHAHIVHAVRTQCEVLDVGKYSNPSFGPFSQVFGCVPGFFWLPKHLGCGTKTLVDFKVILEPRCSRSSIGMATSTTAKKSTWSSSLEGSRSPILDGGESTPGPDSSSSAMLLVITTTRSIDGHLANPMVLTPFSPPPSKQVTGILG